MQLIERATLVVSILLFVFCILNLQVPADNESGSVGAVRGAVAYFQPIT